MLKKAFLTNSTGTLLSRILGYARDVMTASVLGANIYSDIFFVAFKFPNLFRRIVSEGAFSQSFIPSLAHAVKKGGFAFTVFKHFLILLVLLSLVVTLFPETFTKLIAFGFKESEIITAAPFVALNFWYLPLIFITTFFATLLQYRHKFLALSYFPLLLNVALIGALALSFGDKPETVVLNLSLGVIVGGILQALFVLYFSKKDKALTIVTVGAKSTGKHQNITRSDTGHFYKQFLPAVLGSSTAQIASFIDTLLASFLMSGAISYLYYANRIFQLPLAIFALAMSMAIFPIIAKKIKNGDIETALFSTKKAFWFLFLTLGAFCVGGIIMAQEVVTLLFERGAFDANDTLQSAFVLQAYMIGLLPFGLAKLFSLWLYSEGRQMEAAKISAKALVFNILCSLLFIYPLGAFGLALAGSLGGIVLFALTLKSFGMKRFFSIIKDKKIFFVLLLLTAEGFALVYLKEFYAHL